MLPSDAKSTIGQPFIELDVVDSTNIYAMERLQANLAASGTAFFAHHQTAGKGQHGKSWSGEAGTNIALSVVLDCSSFSLTRQFPLSVMVALGVYDLFNKYATDQVSIKWPNDLYWRDRKAGGILIENQVRGDRWVAAVIGIGININQVDFPAGLKNPVSLRQITGKQFDAVALARELCQTLDHRLAQLNNGEFLEMFAAYNRCLFKRGEMVRLKQGSAAFRCRIEGVLENGELRVSGAPKDTYGFGEVEWVLDKA